MSHFTWNANEAASLSRICPPFGEAKTPREATPFSPEKRPSRTTQNAQEKMIYRDLLVWQGAMEIAQAVYMLSANFPKSEMFGLTSQMRRSSSSVAANIAEGWGRDSTKDFLRFLSIAMGSLRETETHLLLAERVGLLCNEQSEPLLSQCQTLARQIQSLQRTLRKKLE